MSSEKFCLRWNDFEANISGAFRELRDDKDFFDVTIACEDEQMQAHKVILSACSPFFRNILRRNHHEHPLLYLKGVKYTDLQSVLNFMYHGEVNVAQEELNSFLAVAEDLRVKGLTQNQGSTSAASTRLKEQSHSVSNKPRISEREPPPPPKRPRPQTSQTFSPAHQPSSFTKHDQDDDIQELPSVKTEPRDTPVYPPPAISSNSSILQPETPHHELVQHDQYGEEGGVGEYEDYGQYGDTSYDEGQYGHSVGQADGGKGLSDPSQLEQYIVKDQSWYSCSVCNLFSHSTKHHVRNHVESKHFPNSFLYSCPMCGKEVSTRKAMERHKTGCKKLTSSH